MKLDPFSLSILKYILMSLLRTITGICKLCRSEHGAALVVEPASPKLQPSPDPIAISEPGPSPSSLREQSIEVNFLLRIFARFLKERENERTCSILFFWAILYIFLNSIGNTQPTTPSGGR